MLTYLELDGFLQQGTPFYAGYSVRPTGGEWRDVFDAFDETRGDFLRRVVESGKEGRTWVAVDPAAVPGEDRERVVRALDYLEQRGLVELKVSDVRQRFTLLALPDSRESVADSLAERFERREGAEAERVRRVLELVEHEGCQVQALVGYFGETLSKPCGHCTHCLTGRAQRVPDAKPPAPKDVDLRALVDAHPEALGVPRQQARFLCGLSSPAATRAKLTRHPLFGALADHRFADVLAWCEAT
jgi:ATP-dependent DNA helicase RecQ